MTKVLVLYYSAWGHMEQMAYAAAEGAKEGGATVAVKRVPELVPEDVAKSMHYKLDQKAPIAKPEELADYDAIIFASGTRYGSMTAQLKNFVDQTGALWMSGALVGKVGSVMTSSATQHGGQETTILGFIPVLMHHGMVVVGLPYAFAGQMGTEDVMGNSPYGASTISGGDGSRQPSKVELDGARFQGKHVATIAAKLARK
jgi:NAD(P)H dehydrogenase (quinone)